MPDEEIEVSYEESTVEELRDELRARDLPVSGHKDELVARLEADDAAAESGQTSTDVEVRAEEVPADPYKRVYSPYELPSNTAAAQAFIDANPDAVDTTLVLEPQERHEAAIANIQDHVDAMAAVGVTVEDPRLEGGAAHPSPPGEEE